jgi:hypothetical protein
MFPLSFLISHDADFYKTVIRFTEESNEESDNEGVDDETLATNLVDREDIELEENNVNDLSDEDKDDCYTSDSCRQTLAKVRVPFQLINMILSQI